VAKAGEYTAVIYVTDDAGKPSFGQNITATFIALE
jgi:hypothetical protein